MIEDFAIHSVEAPGGGAIGIARMPGRSGDLVGDVAMIADWGAALVLSMVPDAEREIKGAGDLPAALAARGIAWRSFPVEDYGIPDEGAAAWDVLARELHTLLDARALILIHCAGGCGRSGMAALRLLVERGCKSQQGIELIRKIRPCAVETDAQFQWAARGQACG